MFNENNNVFNLNNRLWIDLSVASAEEISKIIDSCPSGTLRYEFN